MAGYVLSPLLDHLQSIKRGVKHVAFADDLTNAKKLEEIKIWWNVLMNECPKYGYYRQPSKSILIVRQYYKEYAERIFTGSNIKITREARNLCAALGDISFKEQYNTVVIQSWKYQLEILLKSRNPTTGCLFCIYIRI